MLLKTVVKSKNSISQIIYGKKYNDLKKSFPALDESFNNFIYFLKQKDVLAFGDIPAWTKDSLRSICQRDGIYKDGEDKLICVRTVEEGMFQYMAFYALGTHQPSEHTQKLKGKYITIITRCEDKIHFEPNAFSYLIRDEFFEETGNTRYIFPLLILPTVIPEELEYQWVYLAMRYFNMNLSPSIDYKYLATEPKEIELLKKFNLY